MGSFKWSSQKNQKTRFRNEPYKQNGIVRTTQQRTQHMERIDAHETGLVNGAILSQSQRPKFPPISNSISESGTEGRAIKERARMKEEGTFNPERPERDEKGCSIAVLMAEKKRVK